MTTPQKSSVSAMRRPMLSSIDPNMATSPSNFEVPSLKKLKLDKKRKQSVSGSDSSDLSSSLASSSPVKSKPSTLSVTPLVNNDVLVLDKDDKVLLGRKTPDRSTLEHYHCTSSQLIKGKTKVSRVHAIISLQGLQVVGQNGVMLDGRLIKPGRTVALPSDCNSFELDFYEAALTVRYAPGTRPNACQEPISDRSAKRVKTEALEVEAKPQKAAAKKEPRRKSETIVYKDDSESELDMGTPEMPSHPDGAPDEDIVPIPAGVDLVGLAASTLVFENNKAATMPTSHILASLLPSIPTLNQATLIQHLKRGPFGNIDHKGLKDAQGKLLELQWFYRPELDQDASRRQDLAPFVKSVRGSRAEAVRYYWPKPALKKRTVS